MSGSYRNDSYKNRFWTAECQKSHLSELFPCKKPIKSFFYDSKSWKITWKIGYKAQVMKRSLLK
jgi:hypothetical protein